VFVSAAGLVCGEVCDTRRHAGGCETGGVKAALLAVVGATLLILVGCGSTTVGVTDASAPVTDAAVPGDCPVRVQPPEPTEQQAGPLLSGEGIQSVVVCRYSGMNTPTTDGTSSQAGVLQQSATVTDASTIAALVGAVNEGEPWPSGPIACPADDGRSYELFVHRSPPTGDTIIVTASGCRSVQTSSHGHMASEQLIGILSSIAGEAR
jgi:hypothetical protein